MTSAIMLAGLTIPPPPSRKFDFSSHACIVEIIFPLKVLATVQDSRYTKDKESLVKEINYN